MPICDSKLQYIDIDKPLILNGNGFTIDAKGMTNMARITGNSVQILNTTFSNSKGSAIQIMANNVLINSTFTNNTNLVGSGVQLGYMDLIMLLSILHSLIILLMVEAQLVSIHLRMLSLTQYL